MWSSSSVNLGHLGNLFLHKSALVGEGWRMDPWLEAVMALVVSWLRTSKPRLGCVVTSRDKSPWSCHPCREWRLHHRLWFSKCRPHSLPQRVKCPVSNTFSQNVSDMLPLFCFTKLAPTLLQQLHPNSLCLLRSSTVMNNSFLAVSKLHCPCIPLKIHWFLEPMKLTCFHVSWMNVNSPPPPPPPQNATKTSGRFCRPALRLRLRLRSCRRNHYNKRITLK